MELYIHQNWHKKFAEILKRCSYKLTISSPYVTDVGINFLLKKTNSSFKKNGVINFVTDLSPKNVYQGSTNPNSLKLLFDNFNKLNLWHLSKLHSKVYITDKTNAIVTSGNLTAGGLYNNFEYGVLLSQPYNVALIKEDIDAYSKLGAKLDLKELISFCEISKELKLSKKKQESDLDKELTSNLMSIIQKADDKLIQLKISGGPVHRVFEKSIVYILQKDSALSTSKIYDFIEMTHPDLCDNNIDRIIDGKRFGKKWKHAVRTAQQNLKKKGAIKLTSGKWSLSTIKNGL